MRLLPFAALALTGCVKDVPVVAKLTPPSAELTKACPPLPDVPERDGNPAIRRTYYAVTRGLYGDCKSAHDGLTKWADAASK